MPDHPPSTWYIPRRGNQDDRDHAMIATMLSDPVFRGLAISLLFGVAASTTDRAGDPGDLRGGRATRIG